MIKWIYEFSQVSTHVQVMNNCMKNLHKNIRSLVLCAAPLAAIIKLTLQIYDPVCSNGLALSTRSRVKPHNYRHILF